MAERWRKRQPLGGEVHAFDDRLETRIASDWIEHLVRLQPCKAVITSGPGLFQFGDGLIRLMLLRKHFGVLVMRCVAELLLSFRQQAI